MSQFKFYPSLHEAFSDAIVAAESFGGNVTSFGEPRDFRSLDNFLSIVIFVPCYKTAILALSRASRKITSEQDAGERVECGASMCEHVGVWSVCSQRVRETVWGKNNANKHFDLCVGI